MFTLPGSGRPAESGRAEANRRRPCVPDEEVFSRKRLLDLQRFAAVREEFTRHDFAQQLRFGRLQLCFPAKSAILVPTAAGTGR